MKIIIALVVTLLSYTKHARSASVNQGLRSGSIPADGRRSLQINGADTSRECELIQTVDEVEFQCKSKTTDESTSTEFKDKIDFKIKNRDARGLVVKVEYEQEVETSDEQETETETSYEVVFDRIIEYTKAEGSSDDAYDWENDSVLQSMSLAALGEFSPVVDTPTSSAFSVGSADGHTMFTFTIHRASDGESINANKMKIDFSIENFPWIDSNSFVALISEVESKKEVEVEYEDRKEKPVDVVIDFAEAVEGINGFAPFGSYTWETLAIVNSTAITSTPISVVATSPKMPLSENDDGKKQWVAFSFVGEEAKSASSIYWDPEAGIGYRRIRRRSLVVGLTIGVVALLAVVALTVWLVFYKGCKKVRSLVSGGK